MELVRTRLRLRRYHRRNSFSELRVEVLRRDLRLGKRIIVRVDDDDAQDWVLVIGTVQLIGRAGERLSVNHDLFAALRILARGVAPSNLLRSRQQQLQTSEVPPRDREILNLLRLELRCHIRT